MPPAHVAGQQSRHRRAGRADGQRGAARAPPACRVGARNPRLSGPAVVAAGALARAMTEDDSTPDAPAPVVRSLAQSTARLLDALSGLDAEALRRRPEPEAWSAWDIAYHVAQIEVWYFAKLCEAASTDGPGAMERFLRGWRRLRTQGLALAEEVPEERLDRPG